MTWDVSGKDRIRPPAVAGRFYPSDARDLRETVESLLRSAAPAKCADPQALIAPHAGYIYSGPIAASAYVCWKHADPPPSRIVLIGPAHFVEVSGIAASSASAFQTPLGTVAVDSEAVARLVSENLAIISDEAHAPEHSLEMQLPFLQVLFTNFKIVPLLVGDAEGADVERVIKALWDGGTRFVISSDLTHYLDYLTAQRVDKATANAIEELQPEVIGHEQACGRLPICGLLLAARAGHLKSSTLDLRSSGDTAGPRDQVVGYGAFAFYR